MYRRLSALNDQLESRAQNHLTIQERALRRLTTGEPTEHLQTLTDVLTPVKGYKKLFGGHDGRPPQSAYQTTLFNLSIGYYTNRPGNEKEIQSFGEVVFGEAR